MVHCNVYNLVELRMKGYKLERYLVVKTTTTVRHYEVKAQNADEARNKVAGNSNLRPVASDTQSTIDDVELIDWD